MITVKAWEDYYRAKKFNKEVLNMDWLVYPLIVIFGLVAFVVLLLQVAGLPSNWIVLGMIAVWKLIDPWGSALGLTWLFIVVMVLIAIVGELLEWAIQIRFGRRYGSTTKGDIGGIIGSIIGAIVLLPLFFGLGAVIGALAGAYLGTLVMELAQSRRTGESHKAAWGATMGRSLGMAMKLGLGIAILFMSILRMW